MQQPFHAGNLDGDFETWERHGAMRRPLLVAASNTMSMGHRDGYFSPSQASRSAICLGFEENCRA
jgi:hypothetical protein